MDYEKMHKETLEGLKRLVSEGNITEEVAKKICPDFVMESEDEGIRKEIIGYLESRVATAEETELLYFKRWISYLEKQKEQKPLSTEETELNSIAFLEQLGYTCVPPGAEQKCTNSEKPKEWSEKDKKMLKCIINDAIQGVYPEGEELTWLKDLPNRIALQSKQEQPQVADASKMEHPEVDLEEEIERIVKNEEKFMKFQVRHQLIGYVARHFFELGKNARKV